MRKYENLQSCPGPIHPSIHPVISKFPFPLPIQPSNQNPRLHRPRNPRRRTLEINPIDSAPYNVRFADQVGEILAGDIALGADGAGVFARGLDGLHVGLQARAQARGGVLEDLAGLGGDAEGVGVGVVDRREGGGEATREAGGKGTGQGGENVGCC